MLNVYSGLIYSEILHNRSAWAFFNSSLLRVSQEGWGGGIAVIFHFHFRLLEKGCPVTNLRKYLSEVKFADRTPVLQQKNKSARKKLLPFITQYNQASPSLKRKIMGKWHLTKNRQRLREIFKKPPLISYRKGKYLLRT